MFIERHSGFLQELLWPPYYQGFESLVWSRTRHHLYSGYAKARLQYDDSQPISVCRLLASLKVNKQISSPLSPVFVGWLVVNGRNSAWKTFVRSVRRRIASARVSSCRACLPGISKRYKCASRHLNHSTQHMSMCKSRDTI